MKKIWKTFQNYYKPGHAGAHFWFFTKETHLAVVLYGNGKHVYTLVIYQSFMTRAFRVEEL